MGEGRVARGSGSIAESKVSAVIALIFPCQPVFPILLSLALFGPLIIPPKYHYYTTYSPLYQAKQLV